MICNQNEKYLLKFISCANNQENKEENLLDIMRKYGINIQFKDFNPIYKIIDELNFKALYDNSIRK